MRLAKFPPAGPLAQIPAFVIKNKGIHKGLDKGKSPQNDRRFQPSAPLSTDEIPFHSYAWSPSVRTDSPTFVNSISTGRCATTRAARRISA